MSCLLIFINICLKFIVLFVQILNLSFFIVNLLLNLTRAQITDISIFTEFKDDFGLLIK